MKTRFMDVRSSSPLLQPDYAMQITRRFTREGQDPFAGIEFAPRSSTIRNPNGSVVFEMTDVMVPAKWSQVAVDILAQKYFRRARVPARRTPRHEANVAAWIQRSAPATPDRMATTTSGLYSLILLKMTSTWSVRKYESQKMMFTSGTA